MNLIGEHTDYNLGFVLPFAIDKNALVAVRRRDPQGADPQLLQFASTFGGEQVTSVRLEDLAPGAVPGWAAYPASVAWVLGQQENVDAEVRLCWDRPGRSGGASGLSSPPMRWRPGSIAAPNDPLWLQLEKTWQAPG